MYVGYLDSTVSEKKCELAMVSMLLGSFFLRSFLIFLHPLWAHLNVSIVISVISVLMIENDVHFETTYLNYMKPSWAIMNICEIHPEQSMCGCHTVATSQTPASSLWSSWHQCFRTKRAYWWSLACLYFFYLEEPGLDVQETQLIWNFWTRLSI